MKKYLGSVMTAYAAIVMPLLCLFPLILMVLALTSKISFATVFISIWCALGIIFFGIWLKQISFQLYSWGTFKKDRVVIKSIFRKKQEILYEKCRGCGIGFYVHGILGSRAGSNIFFIYLSYDPFDEKYRAHMNKWAPTDTRIKVAFNCKLFDYLLEHLPYKQAKMLQRDYEKYKKYIKYC